MHRKGATYISNLKLYSPTLHLSLETPSSIGSIKLKTNLFQVKKKLSSLPSLPLATSHVGGKAPSEDAHSTRAPVRARIGRSIACGGRGGLIKHHQVVIHTIARYKAARHTPLHHTFLTRLSIKRVDFFLMYNCIVSDVSCELLMTPVRDAESLRATNN